MSSSNGTPSRGSVSLLIGTRKGAFVLEGDQSRSKWELKGPHYLGHIVQHLVADPRDRRTVLMAAKTGHLGQTLFRSEDGAATWSEVPNPPAFPKVAEGETGRVVDSVFWLTPGHENQPGVWYAGTTPEGLFRSEDGGLSWEPVSGFNDHPMRTTWVFEGGTPGGVMTHSINIDPRDPKHLYLGLSVGGVFESTDGGQDWRPLNQGCAADFIPTPDPEFGHDPHCVRLHPQMPDRLYQQNHCGIYRMERSDGRWTRIGDNMPREVGDVGFPIVLHPRDPETVWVFPMDGTSVWPRTSVAGKPAAYVTRNAGESWQRQDRGLPPAQAWFTVKRQAMAADGHDPVGVYVGTSGGEVWCSADEGESWSCVARYLPEIFSLEAAELGG